MSHIQISLLGGSSQTDKNKRYREACYKFGNGSEEQTEYFSFALCRHLQPDRLVILGTSGSMWDVLLESLHLANANETLFYELIDSAAADAVTQAQLDKLAPLVHATVNADVRLYLIPYGRTAEEQIEILRVMAADVTQDSNVSLDVTHGLRHLPMLTQMSALYLRKARNVAIHGIYYGALDMTQNGVTPVMDLSGLLEIADWVGALHTFDKDQDYGVFSDLLNSSHGHDAELLSEAAYFERSSRPQEARGKLRKFRKLLDERPLNGVAGLFADTLRERTAWVQEENLYRRQATLARRYLQTGDYLRATVMGFEAFLTLQVQRQKLGDAENHTVREQAKQAYESSKRNHSDYGSYRTLRDLRNALAHGSRSNRKIVQAALNSADTLAATLEQLFAALLVSK